MPDTISIRPAGEGDVETIAHFNMALCREVEGRELDPPTVIEGVRRFVMEPSRGRYFVAESAGSVIAQAAYTFEWSDWRNGEIWWFQSVYVHADFRAKGVFRSLFEHIRDLGRKDPDCCGVRLYMERHNETARKAYRKLGFREAGYEVLELLFR